MEQELINGHSLGEETFQIGYDNISVNGIDDRMKPPNSEECKIEKKNVVDIETDLSKQVRSKHETLEKNILLRNIIHDLPESTSELNSMETDLPHSDQQYSDKIENDNAVTDKVDDDNICTSLPNIANTLHHEPLEKDNTGFSSNKNFENDEPTISKKEESKNDGIEENEESQIGTMKVNDDTNKESTQPEDDWLDILGNGMLKKKVIKKGKGRSSRLIVGDIVEIRSEGKLEDGTIVDKSSNTQLILSDEDVIQAFDLAIALMENEEIAILYTNARYAYGIYGRLDYKPPIPRNASITYEIEILSVREGPTISSLTPEERTLYGDKKRFRGNDLYSRGDYAGSINAYKRGLKYLEGSGDPNVLHMKVKCLNNLSAAQLKVKAYAMSIQSLDNVLRLEPENVKALFRKGKCFEGLGKDEEALTCMKKASMLDPRNKMILQELGRLKSKLAVTHQKEKQIYQRMFQQDKTSQKESKNDATNWSIVVGSVVVAALGVLAGVTWLKHR